MRTVRPPLLVLDQMALLQQPFENALAGVLTLMGNPPDRTGVYVAYGRADGLIYYCNVVGEPKAEKAPKYYKCAGNKIIAIGEGGEDVMTSDEVAKPDELIYGGGHRDQSGAIWAASGLPEPYQDACVTLLALRWAGLINKEWSLKIAERTQNPMWDQVRCTFIPEG